MRLHVGFLVAIAIACIVPCAAAQKATQAPRSGAWRTRGVVIPRAPSISSPTTATPVGPSPSVPAPRGAGAFYTPRPPITFAPSTILVHNVSDRQLTFYLHWCNGAVGAFTLQSNFYRIFPAPCGIGIPTVNAYGYEEEFGGRVQPGGYYLLGWNYDLNRWDVFLP